MLGESYVLTTVSVAAFSAEASSTEAGRILFRVLFQHLRVIVDDTIPQLHPSKRIPTRRVRNSGLTETT